MPILPVLATTVHRLLSEGVRRNACVPLPIPIWGRVTENDLSLTDVIFVSPK